MDVINLPTDLSPKATSSFKVFDYKTSKECLKQMVSLQQNTFSFLLEGRKEVFSDKASIAIDKSSFLLMKNGHCLMTEKLPNTAQHYRSILFFFSNESLIEFAQKHRIKNPQQPNQKSIHSFQYDDFLKTYVNALINISTLPIDIQTKLLALKFEELMIYLKNTKENDFIFSLIL